ncbi:MAG: ribbon-helix-helix protein, CopG family [Actinobacteria bacterium]|nr:ribbon-helix-helix protein, CopG family [Actinomycetota bacterium]
MMPMKRTQLYIENDLYDALAKEAAKEKRAVSDLVRELLARELNLRRMKEAKRGAELLLRLSRFAAEGPADLSTRGEDYLLEDI